MVYDSLFLLPDQARPDQIKPGLVCDPLFLLLDQARCRTIEDDNLDIIGLFYEESDVRHGATVGFLKSRYRIRVQLPARLRLT